MKESPKLPTGELLTPNFVLDSKIAGSVFADAKTNPNTFQRTLGIFFKIFPAPNSSTNKTDTERFLLEGKMLCFNIVWRQTMGNLPKVTPEHMQTFFDYIPRQEMLLGVKKEQVYWDLYLDLRRKQPESCRQLEKFTLLRKQEEEKVVFQGFVQAYYIFALATKITT